LYVRGEISLTCDAWQASNADAYFAVTGHWIEERIVGVWTKEHALFGFTQMNTAHNGQRLGQALFKIANRLGIVHKVCDFTRSQRFSLIKNKMQIGYVTCDNATNNDTMLTEFALRYEEKTGKNFDVMKRHIR
jgi:hypothetical protein